MSETEIYQVKRLAESAPTQVYPYIKRLIDLAICALALIWLLPIMGLIALAIVLDSPGSFLFVQTRIGKDGRPFRIYKFRTMSSNYDSSEDRKYMAAFVAGIAGPNKDGDGKTTFKPAMDAHITRVGRFLRKSSLDELPQIWNVLRGDMSLIGPRPNVPWEVEQYTDIQRQRLAVLPGITGLAQVRGRSNVTFQEIVEHDLDYVRRQSFALDMQILWWTVTQVLGQQDAG